MVSGTQDRARYHASTVVTGAARCSETTQRSRPTHSAHLLTTRDISKGFAAKGTLLMDGSWMRMDGWWDGTQILELPIVVVCKAVLLLCVLDQLLPVRRLCIMSESVASHNIPRHRHDARRHFEVELHRAKASRLALAFGTVADPIAVIGGDSVALELHLD